MIKTQQTQTQKSDKKQLKNTQSLIVEIKIPAAFVIVSKSNIHLADVQKGPEQSQEQQGRARRQDQA